ncbi:MAG: hypothetical protein ACU88J_14980, partial [Gammaproteobacteria bacterium]
ERAEVLAVANSDEFGHLPPSLDFLEKRWYGQHSAILSKQCNQFFPLPPLYQDPWTNMLIDSFWNHTRSKRA